jgi:hypothetical protein
MDCASKGIEREALGADVLLLDELLEQHGIGQAGQDVHLVLARQLDAVLAFLHALVEPAAAVDVVDVHELRADRPRVGGLQPPQDLPQGHDLAGGQAAPGEGQVQVGLGEAVVGQGQLLGRGRGRPEGIDVGDVVAADPVVADQLVDLVLALGQLELPAAHVGGVGGRDALPQAHGGEVVAPVGRDRVRVLAPGGVEFLAERQRQGVGDVLVGGVHVRPALVRGGAAGGTVTRSAAGTAADRRIGA